MNQPFYLPSLHLGKTTSNASITASTHQKAWLFQAPKTGNIDRIMFQTRTVTTGCTLDIRLETISGGLPTGTLVSTNSNITQVIGDTDDNVNFVVTLTSSAAVTKNMIYAIRINVSSGSPNLNLAAGSGFTPGMGLSPKHLTTIDSGSTWFLVSSSFPVSAIRYDDSDYPFVPEFQIYTDFSSNTITSASTPDAVGNKFTLPFNCNLVGYWSYADLDEVFNFSLYDSSGVVSGSTHSGTGNHPIGTIDLPGFFPIIPVALTADTNYAAVIEATSSGNNIINYAIINSLTISAAPYGMTYVSAKDPSDFSDFTADTAKVAIVGIVVADVTPVSGGGGGAACVASSFVAA